MQFIVLSIFKKGLRVAVHCIKPEKQQMFAYRENTFCINDSHTNKGSKCASVITLDTVLISNQ